MAKERRRDASSDDDHNQKNYDAICHDSYNKGKDKSATLSCLLGIPGVRNTIITFTSDCQQNPTQAAKRILSKLIFYVWCTVVIISILSLLGIDVNPWNRMQGVTDSDSSASSISENWQNMLPEVFQSSSPVEVESTEEDDEKKEDDEDIPAQVLPVAPKQGNKVNKKLERQLACEELQCVNACNKKIKPSAQSQHPVGKRETNFVTEDVGRLDVKIGAKTNPSLAMWNESSVWKSAKTTALGQQLLITSV
eukprot:CAMPEP_0184007868 /NCGR_PEP_ID=MMETSP0954-20121128/1614_1 /TAXON_ID=627963 /ORGANISM="Aplanochytrium sp, Strain PBS07" /LENGTH=250 /DNA_ID=CAMNT_0026286829 /DNA_START=413 /DNA_END=1166 /DNA_ORIENTATION=+